MANNQYINQCRVEINKAIVETCTEIIHEPLIYFSEADIQQLLTENLKKSNDFSKMYETSVHHGQNSKSLYKTSMIHREYGGGNNTRIDIVILDSKDIKDINNPNLMIGNEYLKPMFAFELGTEKTTDIDKHFKNDIKKLQKATESGYLIHIYKNTTKSKKGTLTNSKTVKKIQDKYKDVFKNNIKNYNKIKEIGILLKITTKAKKITGKCEIFDKKTGNWEKVNISKPDDIKKKIEAQL